MQRVQKILSNMGFCSRRQAEVLIEKGRVSVDDKIITIGDKADPKKSIIKVDNTQIKPERKIYIMLNKPKGYVSTLSDPKKRKTIIDLIDLNERIFSIGRLDLNTEGLIILTNDGDFANLLMHPRYNIEKTYIVQIKQALKNNDAELLKKGVLLLDGMTCPAKIKLLNKEKTLVQITIHEGKNRILRRMFNELGYYVTGLKRIKIGFLELKNLKPGKWRHLKLSEVQKLKNSAELNKEKNRNDSLKIV